MQACRIICDFRHFPIEGTNIFCKQKVCEVIKGNRILKIWMPECDSFPQFFKIEYWNSRDKLLLWFREASQNLSLYRQLFFHDFQRGTKGKMLKNCQNYMYIIFFSSNFERLHEITKEAYPESFNILSWKTQKRVTFWHPYLRILFPFLSFLGKRN